MKVLAIILAGGKRKDLLPLVKDRSKSAVPFFGKYRVIDFILSNCHNSGIRQINVVVQHKFASLLKHIRDGWSIYSSSIGEYIDVYPPQQRKGENWYTGSADSVYQNLFSIEDENPDYVLTIPGDYIYKMDYRDLINFHIEKKADLTISSLPISIQDSRNFGIIQTDNNFKVINFEEKPDKFSVKNDFCTASMGLYVFSTNVLKEIFMNAEQSDKYYQEFGQDILPWVTKEYNVYSYPFYSKNNPNRPAYCNFLRSLKEYYDGNFDILNGNSELDIYDLNWPYRTYQSQSSPTRTFSGKNNNNLIINSAISGGGIIEGYVEHSILGTNVTIEPDAHVKDSILLENVHVKRGAKITKAIIDKGITVPENTILNFENHSGWKEYTIFKDIIVLGKDAAY